MNIIINGKEHFLNTRNICTIIKDTPTTGMYTIRMVNGDIFELETFSFIYFRDYGSNRYAPFDMNKYLEISKEKNELSKNKFTQKN